MGAEAGWEPIKVYTSVDGLDPDNLSREQIKQKLDAASPDTVRRAGQAFIDAADLVGGKVGGNGPSEVGIQAALSRTAKELAAVWRGPAAEEVQSALRALYATAGALGDAMTASGAAMSWYADVVSDAKTNFPAGPSGSGGSNEGAGGGTNGTPSPYPSPPLSSSASSGSFSTPAPSPGAMPYPDGDAAARAHFRKLNQQIQEANNAFAEGLAFELPAVAPLHIDLANSPRIHVGGTGAPTTTSDGVWHGGSYGDGTTGSGSTGSESGGSGSGGGGQSGGGSGGTDGSGTDGSGSGGTSGGTGGGDTGSGSGGADGSGGTGDPGTGDPGAGGSPGAGQPGTGQPGGSGDGSGTAPAVIGGGSTELATTHPLPGATAPAGTTPHALTGYPDPRIPLPTAGPTGALPPGGVIGVYGGARTGYGAGAAVEGGGLLGGYRAAQGGAGSSFLPYAPAAGGAGTGGQDEREREIYDPEPDIWRVTSTISPDRIG